MHVWKARWGALLVTTLFVLTAIPGGALARGGSDARSRQPLLRPADAPDPLIKGEVRTRSRGDRQEFKIQVEGAVADASYFVHIGSGEAVEIEELEGSGRERSYRVRVRDGEGSLPLGASSVEELAGVPLNVYAVSGELDSLVLVGAVGDAAASGRSRWRARETLTRVGAPASAVSKLRVRSKPRRGDERFEVKVSRLSLPDGEGLVLYMEDPNVAASAESAVAEDLVLVGALERKNANQHRYRVRTRKSQQLPFGVASVRDLGGLALEVRNDTTDETLFEGVVPSPN